MWVLWVISFNTSPADWLFLLHFITSFANMTISIYSWHVEKALCNQEPLSSPWSHEGWKKWSPVRLGWGAAELAPVPSRKGATERGNWGSTEEWDSSWAPISSAWIPSLFHLKESLRTSLVFKASGNCWSFYYWVLGIMMTLLCSKLVQIINCWSVTFFFTVSKAPVLRSCLAFLERKQNKQTWKNNITANHKIKYKALG